MNNYENIKINHVPLHENITYKEICEWLNLNNISDHKNFPKDVGAVLYDEFEGEIDGFYLLEKKEGVWYLERETTREERFSIAKLIRWHMAKEVK